MSLHAACASSLNKPAGSIYSVLLRNQIGSWSAANLSPRFLPLQHQHHRTAGRTSTRQLSTSKATLISDARSFGAASNLTAVRVGASALQQLVALGQRLQTRKAASSAAAIMAGDAAEAAPDSAAAETGTASGDAPTEKAGAEVQVSPTAAGEDTQQAASGKMRTAAVDEAVDPVMACERQLEKKIARIRELFPGFDLPELEIHRSAPHHYRLRAEFRVWHEDAEAYYIMFERVEGEKHPRKLRVDQFPLGSVLMNQLMKVLMAEVQRVPVLKRKLFQANFHTTLSGEAMVTLIYKAPVDASWEAAAKDLRVALSQAPASTQEQVTVIARSRKRKLELDCNYVTEKLLVDGTTYINRQVEGAFSQPNGEMCQQMLSWARKVTAGSHDHDLLELYCGNANFTIPLASQFRRVIATEASKAAVETAQFNLKANDVTNALVARMTSEEFTEAWHTKRNAKRLEGLDWETVDLKTILVDPPRGGLDDETVKLLKEFPNVVYISCNPETLATNLQQIKESHEIKRFAVFDQFPGTHHVECGAFLQRRSS